MWSSLGMMEASGLVVIETARGTPYMVIMQMSIQKLR